MTRSADWRFSRRPRQCHAIVGLLALLAVLGAMAQAAAQDRKEGPRSERLQHDPKTGEWVKVAAPITGTDAGDLALARTMLAQNDFAGARAALKQWRKTYKDSPHHAEALFYSADVEVAQTEAGGSADLMRAYKWYEEILDNYAGSEWADRAMRREMLVAEMFLYKKIKQWVWGGLLKVSAEDEALTMLDRLIDDRAPGTPLAEKALRLKADYFYQEGEFADAEVAYARLARDFPRGRYERLSLLKSADAAFASFPGVKFDDTPLLSADERYRKYADQFPDAARAEGVGLRLDRIRENRAEKEYLIADYYHRTGAHKAAEFYFRFVAENWPDTTHGAQARHRLESMTPVLPPDIVIPSASQPSTAPAEESPAATQPAE